MKNTKLITLGIVLVSTSLAVAQDTDVLIARAPLPPPDDAMIEPELFAAVAGQQAQLAATAERLAEAGKAQAGAQKRLMLAQAGGGGMGGEFGAAMTTVNLRSPRALVIPKEATDAKSLAEVEEDLGVMAHILGKTANGGDKTARAMGIAVFGRASVAGGAPQNMYIEGHGAIFVLNVDFPLQPPPVKETEIAAKEADNNEWEEARREMARPGGKGQGGANPFAVFEEHFGGEPAWSMKLPAVEYDADKVEDLKKDLINALKNAANIRRLKADETVTVVVSGMDGGAMARTFKSTSGKPGTTKNERVVVAKAEAGERPPAGGAARLIFRVRKADADAFQSGKLNFEDFRKKVSVLLN